MNNGAQGQPAQGQPSGAQPQQRQMALFKPEQMRKLPDNFSAAEKEKWEQGLKALYGQMERNGPETQAHMEAKRKLYEFSRTLTSKLQNFARQNQGAQQGQQAGAARPASQGQAGGQTGGQDGEQNSSNQPAPQATRPQIPPKILEHVHSFPYTLPPQLQPGTPEALKWIGEAKSRYVKGLVAMDTSTQRIAQMDAMINKRNEEGRPLSAEEEKEYKEKKETSMKQHAEAKQFVDNFRKQQQVQHARAAGANANANANAAAAANSSSTANAAANQQGNAQPAGGANAAQAAARAANSAAQAPNPALQNTQTVNAAIEAARAQQMSAGRTQMPQNGQAPNQNAPSNQNLPQHQGGQVQHIKQEAGVPQINTQVQGRPMQNNSPQSAIPQSAQSVAPPQSAIPNTQVPRALTHPQALQTAARTYSNGGPTSGTPNVMGQGHAHTHPSARETQNVITNKMPIPKHLPERAAQAPIPVQMPQARPTYTGGPNHSGNGVLSQPVLQRTPGYSMNTDGDGVLSRKKLNELVRQVTGGGDVHGGGEALTPEVEESILTVADNFVDQVLHAACKNAKERGSKVLEIRDIQLTLERGYNIRIPGYASDEIRTVRKIQPSPAWISKMSAVQASKVTGGRNSD